MWLKGTTNCTWYVPKRLQIIEELAQKQLFKAIMNKKNAFDTRISIFSSYRQEIMDRKCVHKLKKSCNILKHRSLRSKR